MTLVTWAIIAGLIAANALYVAAEFAAVSSRRTRIRQMAEEGSSLARWVLPVLEDGRRLDRYVAACQIGITLSSLMLGAYGQATLSRNLSPLLQDLGWFGPAAAQSASAIIVLVGLTSLQVVMGELVPKSLALQYPARLVLWTAPPMRWSLRLFSPLIAILNGSGVALLRAIGMPQTGHRHIHSPEEIRLLIAESHEGGVLDEESQHRFERALELSTHSVRRLMIPRPRITAVDVDAPVSEIKDLITSSPYTRLPVYRQTLDNIIGVLHARDFAIAYIRHGDRLSVERIMRPAVSVPDTMRADRLISVFRENRTHQVVVIDEYGGIAGLVTLEDYLARVVGEVGDEFKRDHFEGEPLPDGRVRLPGMMDLGLAEEWLGVRWEGDAATVGGHVTNALGRIPEPGERLMLQGVEVEVERVLNHATASVIVTPVGRSQDGEAGAA